MRKRVLCLAVTSLLVAGAANAADEDLVKYRQKLMEVISGHMGNTVAIIKSEVPYKENLVYHAKALADAAPLALPAFKTKAMSDKSEALPEIWDNWAEFEKYGKKMEEASASLSAAVSSGQMAAIGGALNDLGKSCKGCHDDFVEEH